MAPDRGDPIDVRGHLRHRLIAEIDKLSRIDRETVRSVWKPGREIRLQMRVFPYS